MGYWQLILAISAAMMLPAPNLVFTGASSQGVEERSA
jgi:hypothetical protein